MKVINKGDKLYFARIIPKVNIYDVCELRIRTVEKDYFVGIDKRDKQAHVFGYNRLDEDLFENRSDALKKVQFAEKNKKTDVQEIEYEEY